MCSHTEADPPVYQGVAVAAELLKAISALPADWHLFQPGWED